MQPFPARPRIFYMSESDKELALRCSRGDSDAFGRIVDAYQDRLYSFSLRLLNNPSSAEEAAQESFVRAFVSISSYDSRYEFAPWIFRILHNVCVDFMRGSGRCVSIDAEDFPELPDGCKPVEETVMESLDSERIEALLSSLPPVYSEALLLQYRENMGPADIARVIGVPEGTVKARVFRGREMIKARLAWKADATV